MHYIEIQEGKEKEKILARVGEVVAVMADVTGLPSAFVKQVARRLGETGNLGDRYARGVNAPHLNADNITTLLLAIMILSMSGLGPSLVRSHEALKLIRKAKKLKSDAAVEVGAIDAGYKLVHKGPFVKVVSQLLGTLRLSPEFLISGIGIAINGPAVVGLISFCIDSNDGPSEYTLPYVTKDQDYDRIEKGLMRIVQMDRRSLAEIAKLVPENSKTLEEA